MKKIKKALKLLALICLILLAGLGIGIGGAVTVPFTNSRRDAQKENIELVEDQDEESTIKLDQANS